MVGNLLHKDTYVPTAKELRDQYNAPSYDKEKFDQQETEGITTEQIQEVRNILKEANEQTPGVVCPRDEIKYLAYLERDCSPEQRQDAIQELPEHLEKKTEYLEEYQNTIQEHFSVNEKITPEGKTLLKEYRNMTGVERKEAGKKLKLRVKELVQEKKTFEELLQESPHFSENGELTPKAQEVFDEFHEAGEGVKKTMKRKLLEKLRQHERSEKQCEQFYKAANNLYEKGQYFTGELLLEFVVKLCEKYPDSPRMQVIKEWNTRDLENLKDHTKQQREINKLLLLRDAFVGSEDLDSAFEASEELLGLSEQFLNTTIDRNGQEVVRKEKYKTPYLQKLHQDVSEEHHALQSLKREKDRLEEEREDGVIEEEVVEYMNTEDGRAFAVEMGALEEELEKDDEQERTDERAVIDTDPDANEDIANRTDAELDGNQEDESEVVMDFTQSNTATNKERAYRLSQLKNVNTGVSKDGRLITDHKELQNLTDKRTTTFVDGFVEKQRAEGNISEENLDLFEQTMEDRARRGEISKQFTADSRKAGREVVEFGARFKETAEELGKNISEQGTREMEKKGTIMNLSEALIKKRQEQREAA